MKKNREELEEIIENLGKVTLKSEKQDPPFSDGKKITLTVKNHPGWSSIDGVPTEYHERIITGIHAMKTLMGRGRKIDFTRAYETWSTTTPFTAHSGISVVDPDLGMWVHSLHFVNGEEVITVDGPDNVLTAIKYSQEMLAEYLSTHMKGQAASSTGI